MGVADYYDDIHVDYGDVRLFNRPLQTDYQTTGCSLNIMLFPIKAIFLNPARSAISHLPVLVWLQT